MRTKVISSILLVFLISTTYASDISIDIAISGLTVPVMNPENGQPSVSMVYLESDLTIHARSIGLNGFIRSTDGYVWASYGTCRYNTETDHIYCAFNAENVTLYFSMSGPTYSGEITAVDNNGNVFDTGTATIVGL